MKIIISVFIYIFICFRINAQWQQINNGLPSGATVRGITSNSQYLFLCNDGSGVYRSSNQGNNWEHVNSGITNNSLWALKFINSNLFAGTHLASGFRSSNNGTNWVNIGLTSPRNFIIHNNYLFGIQWSTGVVRSTDNGNSWINSSSGITGGGFWPVISYNGYLFVGGQSGGIFRSTNDGSNWTQINSGITNTVIYAFAGTQSALYAGGAGGIYKSSNYGNNWVLSSNGIEGNTIYALLAINNVIAAGTSKSGVFLSYDAGANWVFSNAGLTNMAITELYSDGTYLYAGSLGGGIFRRPLTEISSITQISAENPTGYELSQNYPNPFNPVTNIRFSIPKKGNVKLTVFDMLGKEISILFNGLLTPGSYVYDFRAESFPSGTYFYRLKADDYSKVKKMILIK